MLEIKEIGFSLVVEECNLYAINDETKEKILVDSIENEELRTKLRGLVKDLQKDKKIWMATCSVCLKEFPAQRTNADTCGNKCRQVKKNNKKKEEELAKSKKENIATSQKGV